MGKQTDTHIATVTGDLSKLKTALDDMDKALVAFAATWNDLTGSNKPGQYQAAFNTNLANFKTASAAAKTALADAKRDLAAMDKFVVDKDKGTWNPLAKKSIGKAKKFVANAKTQIAEVEQKVSFPSTDAFQRRVGDAMQLITK